MIETVSTKLIQIGFILALIILILVPIRYEMHVSNRVLEEIRTNAYYRGFNDCQITVQRLNQIDSSTKKMINKLNGEQ